MKVGKPNIYPYRFILIESRMPLMDGFDATSMILDIYQSMKIKPSPYIVGIGEVEFIQNGEEAGMNELI